MIRQFSVVILLLLVCLHGKSQLNYQKTVYSWLSYETIPRDRSGKINGVIEWRQPHRIDFPGDKFVFYRNNDSILMKTPGDKKGDLFKKTTIHALKWKPAMQYGNKLFFIGTYTNANLPGLYFSFYVTKDLSSFMQLHYTNPGNLTDVLFFSRNPVNTLQKNHLIIDPGNEKSEPEMPVLKTKAGN